MEADRLNELNRTLRKAVVQSGEFYIVQTELDGTIWLRTALMNAMTDDVDLERLIKAVLRHGVKIAGELT
jgi:L-2,4-diaminobutyrate decarboxylase